MDSLINLAMSWPSLPTMLKLSWLRWCPVDWMCTWIGEGSLKCSLYLSPQGPGCLTNIFFLTVYCSTLVTVHYSTLLLLWVLVLGSYQHLFNGPATFGVCLYPVLCAGASDAFPQALNIWDNYVSHTGSSPGGDG